MAASARRGPELPGRGRSQPRRENVPAMSPMTTATMANGAAYGLRRAAERGTSRRDWRATPSARRPVVRRGPPRGSCPASRGRWGPSARSLRPSQDDVHGDGHRYEDDRARVELARQRVETPRLEVLDEGVGAQARCDGQDGHQPGDAQRLLLVEPGERTSPASVASPAATSATLTRMTVSSPCHGRRRAASRPTRSMKRSKNVSTSASTAMSRFGRTSPGPTPVGHRLARRPAALELDLHRQRLRPCQRGVERRRGRERIVDEGAVEAVVVAVELEVEAQCILDEAHQRARRGVRPRPRSRAARGASG